MAFLIARKPNRQGLRYNGIPSRTATLPQGDLRKEHARPLLRLFLRRVDMGGKSVQCLGGFADGFAERRMWMDAHGQVLRSPAHFDRDDGFRDELASARAD